MKTITLNIEGMHCNGCALGLEGALEDLSFVKSASVSYEIKKAVIECDGEPDMAKIDEVVRNTGFSISE